MTQDILKATKSGMEKGLENAKREFSTVRTGKASPNMLDTIMVEAYGSLVPLNQVASVSTPEARTLLDDAAVHLDAAAAATGADHRAIDIQREQLDAQRAALGARGARATPARVQPLAG
jgi:hypothetical protein